MALEGAKLTIIDIPATPDFRRLSTRTVRARGIDYLFIGDDSVTAADMRADPQRWGLKPVVTRDRDVLYQIQ